MNTGGFCVSMDISRCHLFTACVQGIFDEDRERIIEEDDDEESPFFRLKIGVVAVVVVMLLLHVKTETKSAAGDVVPLIDWIQRYHLKITCN